MGYFREPTLFRRYISRTAPIIVSSINSLLYSLAIFLYNIVIKTISKTDNHIENSFKFVKELDDRDV